MQWQVLNPVISGTMLGLGLRSQLELGSGLRSGLELGLGLSLGLGFGLGLGPGLGGGRGGVRAKGKTSSSWAATSLACSACRTVAQGGGRVEVGLGLGLAGLVGVASGSGLAS